MANYDSDSSEGEFTETNVLLGYASKDAEEDTISKLGGHPEWMDSDKPPSAALARCKVCKDLMVLLLQLNGELPEKFPTHERRLYVFTCRRATCRRKTGSIRVLRGVRVWKDEGDAKPQAETKEPEKKEAEVEVKKDAPRLGETLFGANSSSNAGNPFGASSNPFSSQPAKPTATEEKAAPDTLTKTFAETLAIGTTPTGPPPPPEPWPETASLPPPYPTLFLADADYETLDEASTKLPANVQVLDTDAPEPSALDREAFESAMDATFQKFADRLAQNPDQVIRYEFGGAPLLYSKTDAVGELLTKRTPPGCPNCNSRRTFEVQLTPNAIAELEADDPSLDGMEWGTIIVAVCEKDCVPRHANAGEAGYLEEWAGVQWEELAKNN
ncbi:putative 20S rRNA accumulation 4-like protein [Cladobotryum mycophilum]|uniref:20S rRNA accumulation 4-like protein n=1 Tax=Cladobotryum mycophilum TaxID=491253 RepID=A0ABR0SVA8_9HYPO